MSYTHFVTLEYMTAFYPLFLQGKRCNELKIFRLIVHDLYLYVGLFSLSSTQFRNYGGLTDSSKASQQIKIINYKNQGISKINKLKSLMFLNQLNRVIRNMNFNWSKDSIVLSNDLQLHSLLIHHLRHKRGNVPHIWALVTLETISHELEDLS